MSTVYPNDFDSDLEIQRVDDNITEIGGDVINSLRDAVFMVERVVGLNPQGNKASLADRISASIDEDGNIRTDAIDALGLASLPITNAHISSDASIDESKLNLDFSTQSLKNSINSLLTDIGGTQSGITTLTSSLSLHILGQGNFHDGYDIKINSEGDPQIGLAGLSAVTVGDAINELAALLIAGDPDGGITPHMDLNLPYAVKHRASEIGIDSSSFSIIDATVSDVQAALNSIDAKQGAFGARHLDVFHSNGILKEINSGELYNPNRLLLGPVDGANYVEGTSVITIPGVTSFSDLDVLAGDIIEILDILDEGTYQIRAVGPLTAAQTLGDLPVLAANQLAIFHTFTESRSENDHVVINVYKPSSVSSQTAPLACAIRNNETIVDTITVLNPDAAKIVSVGFNGSILNAIDGYEIAVRVGLGNGQFRELTIPNLNRERLNLNQANPVDAKSVAERINAYVADPSLGFHFPISAFRIGNELAIAHNLVGTDYTLEILDGYTANFALGLDAYGANVVGEVVIGNANNSYVINGIESSSIYTIFDGYASIESTTDTFSLWTNGGQIINPLRYGIIAGSVIHITGHENLSSNGSYTVLTSTSTNISTFATEPITAVSSPTVFNVKVTNSHISLVDLGGAETDNGLVQVLINSSGKTIVNQRLTYGTNLGAAVEIINVSDTFPIGSVELNVILNGTLALFNIISDSFSGPTATVHKDFKGLIKVFHPNNLDFIIVKTIPGTISGGIETITVDAPLLSDEALELCLVHFNGALKATNIIDLRLFGNIASDQIRNDFVEMFSQRPVQELRSDGVVRGFDVLDIPFIDTITGMQALPVQGGVAYVNGVRVAVETQRVLVQSVDEQGSSVTGPRIVAINEFGSLQVFNDELGEILSDGYDSSSTFGKVLPLYQVMVVAGEITDYTDLRLFINSIDSKLELIVDETNNVVGNFRSLEGALLYASSYPNKEHLTIKIINSIFPSEQVIVPDGISIMGSSAWGGNSKHQIINSSGLGNSFIVLLGNNRLENIEIISEVATMNGALVEMRGSGINVEKCLLRFGQDVTSTDADIGILVGNNATNNVRIVDNKLDMVYSGIVSLFGCNDLIIDKNIITNLAGTGGTSNGIKLGTATRPADSVAITNNTINVPSVVSPADIRGVSIDIGETIENLRITNNSIIHTADNTMTNGIRIENEAATGNKITNLFISENTIDGIKLDDNDVWGIYLADVLDGQVHHNILKNIGVSGNTDVGCIGIGANVDYAEISYNILKDCDVTRGIEITGADQVNISNNTLETLGISAYYVSGNATHSSVSDNILIGPGLKGIRWTGTNSKISDNNLSQPSDASNYAFEEHAIYVQTSDVDIVNNTITGMVFAEESIGISNVSAASERLKIISNTISGSYMLKGIELFADGHSVSNNRIFNENGADSGNSVSIELNDVTNSLIMGNLLRGTVSAAIKAVSSLETSTISNNMIDARDMNGNAVTIDYGFSLAVAYDCFISGNRMMIVSETPPSNLIGTSTETSFGDSNSIGINDGFRDRRNIHASQATASTDSASGDLTWAFKESGGEYWELFNGSIITRNLYFSLDNLPNGSRIISVQAQGVQPIGPLQGSLTIEAFRKSRTDLVTVDSISGPDTITSATFGTIAGGSDGLVSANLNDPYGEPVDHYNYSYYVVVTHTGGAANPENIQIHGLNVIFRY